MIKSLKYLRSPGVLTDFLKGLLVDVSPHLEKGRLYAGEIRIIDFLMEKLELAVQSDLFKIIRNDNKEEAVEILLACFESKIYDINYFRSIA
ncbi:MAG TPA: hypothetical protein VLA74_09280 [Nitrososphaeraceae archaeon]|nr:hypothetical protein [Nitrososphaeraceae archaeon]